MPHPKNFIRFSLAILLSPLFIACQSFESEKPPTLPDGVQLVTEHTPSNKLVGIPFEKYKLENGLTVILHKDTSDPLVHVDVTYHVGSAREEMGKSGFAHFFEHMMFQGSENVADEQHFKLITEAGGSMNGSTTTDRTNYYQTVPANQLEKILWLEADRMGFLLGAVTQEKFEVQRETVKNERAQRIDNQPYGLLNEKVAEALYPQNHPYSWPVIGYVEDLDRVSVDDLKTFFQRWYGPNNAVLTIGGDIDSEQALLWVNKYFGNIAAGPEVVSQEKAPVSLAESRYLTLPDDVYLPLLQITFPTVHIRHEDEAPLDVLSNILGHGKSSLFYKNMVQDGYAVQAQVGHPCIELACQFELMALANPRKVKNLQDIEQRIRNTLDEFESRGVKAQDIEKTKASIRASTIFGLQSVSGKVSTLAYNEYMSGNPDMVEYDLERYGKVTAEDVMRVYRQYVKGKHSVVISIVPRGQESLAAKEENFKFKRKFEQQTAEKFLAKKAVKDDFERRQIPSAGTPPIVKVPEFWQHKFSNGIDVWGHQTSETPTVLITLNLEGGPLLDSFDKAGLATFTSRMMNASTQNYSDIEIENKLALLGSHIRFDAGGRNTQIEISSLTEHLDETLLLLEEKLFRPAFLEIDFNRIKRRVAQQMKQKAKRPHALMSQATIQILYGEDNRMGLPDPGNSQTLDNITLDDVKSFYHHYYTPHLSSLIAVGNLDKQALLSKLSFLQSWQDKPYSIPPYQSFPEPKTPKIYLVNKPESSQSLVRILKPFLPFDALGEQFRSSLMNFPLGGGFNSRINLNLREDKGYTYGSKSRISSGKTLGRFTAGGAMNHINTADALAELFKEIDSYQKQGMTEDEQAFMRSAFTLGDALSYETPSDKAGFLQQLYTYGLDKDFVHQQNKIINSISLEELNKLASKHLVADSMQVIIVGDSEILQSQLQPLAEALGREIVQLNISM